VTLTVLLIAGIIQVCTAPAVILARRPIAEWLADNVPPLDVTWFHVRGGLYMALGGVAGAISGALFIVMAASALAQT
jgi:hypothetical protein